MLRTVITICFATTLVTCACGADWLQFHGTAGSGAALEDSAPVALDQADNLAWKVELTGRGLSGPIVIGNRVVVTSSSGYSQGRLHVHCFDANSGESLWERQFWATGRTMCHPKMCVATPTPASDGKRIFAFYSSNDLACLDLEGNLLWFRGLTHDYPNASNSLGMSSSPIVAGDTLIVQVENDAESFATGLDVQTGVPRWRTDRPRRANWTSPVLLNDPATGKTLALLQSSAGISAVDPRTGEEVWSFDKGASTIPSSAVSDGIVYIPSNGLTAVKSATEDGKPEVLWNENRLGPATPTPVVHEGHVYTVNGAGVVNCADTASGEIQWRLRLTGPFSATPILANGHLYFFSEKGLAQVVSTGEAGEIVAKLDLGESILASPAVSNGALYVRSDKHLWKFAE